MKTLMQKHLETESKFKKIIKFWVISILFCEVMNQIAQLVEHLTRDLLGPGSNPGLVYHYITCSNPGLFYHYISFNVVTNPTTRRQNWDVDLHRQRLFKGGECDGQTSLIASARRLSWWSTCSWFKGGGGGIKIESFPDISNLFLHYSPNPFHIPLKSCIQLAIKAVKSTLKFIPQTRSLWVDATVCNLYPVAMSYFVRIRRNSLKKIFPTSWADGYLTIKYIVYKNAIPFMGPPIRIIVFIMVAK